MTNHFAAAEALLSKADGCVVESLTRQFVSRAAVHAQLAQVQVMEPEPICVEAMQHTQSVEDGRILREFLAGCEEASGMSHVEARPTPAQWAALLRTIKPFFGPEAPASYELIPIETRVASRERL